MKKSILLVAGIVLTLLGFNVQAQITESQPTASVSTWDYKKNPTVAAITSQYQGKYITVKATLTDEDIFPAIGNYVSATDGPALSITLDEHTKGMVWIEGLSQGKIKATLRKSPAIYKIPAQKTEAGIDVAEGTLIFDKELNTLNIVIGKPYHAEDPSLAFAVEPVTKEVTVPEKNKSSKSKTKVKPDNKPKPWVYTGTKLVVKETGNN